MSLRRRWYEIDFFLRRYLTPAVKYILLITTVVFLIQFFVLPLASRATKVAFYSLFAEEPGKAIYQLQCWQFVTYMFLHGGPFHFLFNMLVLWFFAPRLEMRWGSWRFLKFYFIVGIGAGLFHAIVSILADRPAEGIIGASGALYGILLAFALYWPDETVWLWAIFPIKIKLLVIILGFFAFLGSVGSANSGISHITHLGGLLVAFIYLKAVDLGRGLRRKRRSYRPSRYGEDFSNRDFYR